MKKFTSVLLAFLILLSMTALGAFGASASSEQEIFAVDVVTPPEDFAFIAGNSYNFYDFLSGMTVGVTNLDGRYYTYSYEDDKSFFENRLSYSGKSLAEGIFTPEPGENVIFVSLDGFTTEFSFNAKEVESLKIISLPETFDFVAGNRYPIMDLLTDMRLRLNYSDGTGEDFGINEDFAYLDLSLTISDEMCNRGVVEMKPGENILTLSCGAAKAELSVNARQVQSIAISKLPDKTRFVSGVSCNISDYIKGMEVTVDYADGSANTYAYNDEDNGGRKFCGYSLTFTGENGGDAFEPAPGDNTVTVSCGGAYTSYAVFGAEVESIEVLSSPDRLYYEPGEEFNIYDGLKGTVIKINYSNLPSEQYAYDDTENGGREFFMNELAVYGENGGDTVYIDLNEDNTVTLEYGAVSAQLQFYATDPCGVFFLGDANLDGVVDIRDAAAIQLYKARLYDGRFEAALADANMDGRVDISDAAYIQLELAGLLKLS